MRFFTLLSLVPFAVALAVQKRDVIRDIHDVKIKPVHLENPTDGFKRDVHDVKVKPVHLENPTDGFKKRSATLQT
ncbi:hypothetical protein GQ43DRAFT_478577 [Delitschia confertaspora ATCC 74209]|uniref:Uncharacterized protein n=1 Tax=Delitschia confertaspora ATCC 74209 TaxID=1513339 RepID=A0A9P4JQT7_9PLEO|nr:hypothetical protein GQ43DRAFT_478577 [Delitschia confertaspora ATCC 74209]